VARLPLVLLGIGMHVIALHLIFSALNVLVTLHRSRPADMGWFDLPVFGWAMATTSVLELIAAPILAGLGLLLIAEVGGTQGLFDPASAGDPLAWRRLFWFFGHPAIYIALVPALGVVGEIFVTFSRKPLHAYRTSVLALFALGLLGLAGWGVHLVIGGISPAASTVYSAMGLLVAVPAAIVVANWLATLHRGAIEPTTPLLYAIAALVQVTIAGLGGLFLAALGTAEQLAGTTFATATFHYVMVGGVITGGLGGLYYWWPKLCGRLVDERGGRIGVALVFSGIQLALAGQFVLGAQGFPVRQHAYPPDMATWHILSGVGAAVLALGLLVAAANLLGAIRSGAPAPVNPWGGTTLEWRCPSPPPSSLTAPPAVAGELYDFGAQTFDAAVGGYVQAGND
jgi:cytochrome c oxidase subunit 1